MAFPGSIISLPNPAGTSPLTTPDHALLHGSVNNELKTIETFLGTNSGTNLFQGYQQGWFPLALNGGTPQTSLQQGTYPNATLSTPTITGGAINSTTINNGTITGTVSNNALVNGGTYATPTLSVWNGWVQANEIPSIVGTASYFGTLGVGETASTKFDKGDKLLFIQNGTSLYMSIYGLSGTTILVTGGTDFVLGTGAITNFQYSKVADPNGHPGWYNCLPTFPTGFGSSPGTSINRFRLDGNKCSFYRNSSTAGSSNSAAVSMVLPVTPLNTLQSTCIVGNNTSTPNTPGLIMLTGGTNVANFGLNTSGTGGFTATGFKDIGGLSLFYEF